jgi:selenocysteine lyase/cysteine desulfurase
MEGVECGELASQMGERGICVRFSLHCAPLAHKTAGTLDTGTVRFSFSSMNTISEILKASDINDYYFKKM